jgi:hypothetical protein
MAQSLHSKYSHFKIPSLEGDLKSRVEMSNQALHQLTQGILQPSEITQTWPKRVLDAFHSHSRTDNSNANSLPQNPQC